jgi:hypothetical protein
MSPSPSRSPTRVRAASQRDSLASTTAMSRTESASKRQTSRPLRPGFVARDASPGPMTCTISSLCSARRSRASTSSLNVSCGLVRVPVPITIQPAGASIVYR